MRPLFLIICLMAPALHAASIYQTGFEPPAYNTGQLNGQDGWTGTTSLIVENTVANTGSMAAQLNGAGLTQQIGYHTVPYTFAGNPDTTVTITAQFFLDANAASNIWTVIGYGSSSDFLGQLVVESNGTLAIGNTGGFIQGPAITKGVWNTYTAVLDYNTQTTSGYLNGVLFSSIGFSSPATDLSYVLVGLNNASAQSIGSGYWDDVSVTSAAVPEPGSVGLVAAGALILLVARRRRTTAPASWRNR